MSQEKTRKLAIGIDLGTTYSAISLYDGIKSKIVPNANGENTTPSIIAFKGNTILIGQEALRQAYSNPTQTFFSVKRLMGKKFAAISESIKKRLPYELCELENGDVGLIANGKKVTPSYLMGLFLQYLVESVSGYLGEKITDVVITVPAYFDADQKQATKDAGTIAGLNVIRIIAEPTAAAIAYEKNGYGMIFDLGGGTYDISIVYLENGIYDVKSTSGNTELGGDDFTNYIVDWVVKRFNQEHGINLYESPQAMQRVREASETAKKQLSFVLETTISIPFIWAGPLNIEYAITRAQFESMIEHLVKQCIKICSDALKDADIPKSKIDYVLLVGGSTRIPLVSKLLNEFIGKEPMKDINPDEAVALGAGIQAGILLGVTGHKEIIVLDVTALAYGIETQGGIFTPIIEKNTTIPTKNSKVFTTTIDNQPSVHIAIYQGARSLVADNKLIATFDLIGIENAPRGIPQIEVTFDIDANGLMEVSAIDKKTGKVSQVRVDPNSGATKEEVELMKEQAEKYRQQDIDKLNLITKRNDIDTHIYSIQKKLDSIKSEESNALRKRLDEVSSKRFNVTDIKELEEIEKSIKEVGEEVSKLPSDNKTDNNASDPVNPAA